ncbi:MAG: hypothetical protein AAF642_06045 [Pseudomonadota bacterium]
MTDDNIENLRKRVNDRREAASAKLREALGKSPSTRQTESPPHADQASLQAASAMFQQSSAMAAVGNHPTYGDETTPSSDKPAAPTGQWRCSVNSPIVSIDLMANIAKDGSLSGQGTIIYVATNRMFQVSGKGDWTLLPPDQSSEDWLFKFRLHPSNHAIFSWFASPTDSPNHMSNRFVSPNTGGVVETRCERQS